MLLLFLFSMYDLSAEPDERRHASADPLLFCVGLSGLREISEYVHTSGSRVPILSPSYEAVAPEIYPPAGTIVFDGSTRTSVRFARSSTLFVIGPAESQKAEMGMISSREIMGIVGYKV